jgi:DNA-binding transcriptional LysR family regulator
MKNVDWDDIRCFLAVARGGGLSQAAKLLDSSPATLGRRMLSLERMIGRNLFARRQTGYTLTPDGQEFLAIALSMDASSKSIDFWLSSETERPVVRLSAGTWTANFLCENFSRIWTQDDPFIVAFHTTEARLDIMHREVDIGIRNRKPAEPNLAVRRTGSVAHAAFRARHASAAAHSRWIATVPDHAITPSTRWVEEQTGLEVVAYASTPRTLYDLIRAGLGNGVIPCFAGDRDAMLERAAPPMVDLMEEQWLVMHDEGRHVPAIRTVIDRVADVLTEHGALFRGHRPLGKSDDGGGTE